MITAVLTTTVLWCLFYGKLRLFALVPLCAGLGLAVALAGRHNHARFIAIDVLAQKSRLNNVNAALKFWTALALMALCVSSRGSAAGLLLTAAAPIITVSFGGIKPRDYARVLMLPASFLMLSGLTLLFEIYSVPTGVISLRFFSYWLCVTEAAQARTALVMARALGAASCLFFLSLSTPMADIIGVLRRARCPGILIELMYLIYRYVFILLSMYYTMRDAADSRLGGSFLMGVRSAGKIYAALLERSYGRARISFDAMESRCFNNELRFLESENKIRAAHVRTALLIIAAVVCCW